MGRVSGCGRAAFCACKAPTPSAGTRCSSRSRRLIALPYHRGKRRGVAWLQTPGDCLMLKHRSLRPLALIAALAWPPFAVADDALWALLRGGGQVVMVRHALTTPGVGDPPGMKLDDCSTQR